MRFQLTGLTVASACFASSLLAQGGFRGEGVYVITNLRSGQAISVIREDQRVAQFDPNGDIYQGWFVTPADPGFYFIRNAATGYALSATPGNAAPVIVSPLDGGAGQQWAIEPGKDGNAIVASRAGRVLDIPAGTRRRGAPIHTFDRDGDSNQRFIFRPVRAAGPFARLAWLERERASRNDGVSMNCSSDDGGRHWCPTDTRGGVLLARQISGSPCVEGQTWGFDTQGIWVDRGCRAEFRVNAAARPGWTPALIGPAVEVGPGIAANLISCSSDDGARHYCAANIRGPVALTRQLTGTPCVEGQSWGFDRGGVWVDRGCSAEFQLSAGEVRNPDRGPAPVAPPPPGPPAPQTITCFSQNNRRQDCPADTRGGVSLARQMGGTPCIEGQSWGYGRIGVWVDRGCRAVFELGGAGPGAVSPGVPPPPPVPAVVTVTCSSSDGARHFCPADTSSGVTMLRQIGDAACAQNESWGFDRQGIWVNRGCSAVFQIGGGRARQPVY